ncbi:D-glycerate dehydrogenase [Virgibacillus sp. C22-A2]|uniref:D-glycerate dehydrogenase n=1 Tax=Virgibacillus tibetensis TaxID=3042313 RepID=A0ABU6KIE6_9BACI|nr:D-glycerate dehydrogenase [Virgibacillus sp. C22-A2]
MTKPLIYISRKIPKEIIVPYETKFEFRMWEKENEPVPRRVLIQELKEVDGLLCLLTEKVDKDLLEAAPQLKIIANMAVGYDNITIDSANDRGVVVTNTPDVLTETTADLTFTLMLATARRIVEAADYIRSDRWEHWSPYLLAGSDIHHKTIGIVGMGRIGEAVARRAKGFGMSVLYHNRSRKIEAEKELQAKYTSFDQLLKEADFVVSMVPLTDSTRKIFNREAFGKMKSSAIFINASRGGTVDEDDLLEALQTKEIKAAGLDVYTEEPIRGDHPLMNLTNAVCFPHIGSASIETRTAMLQLCLENLAGYFYGDGPKTPV